jgi:flagellar M-ring protein FliF
MATVEADVLGSRLDAAARAGMGDGGVTVSTSRDVARTNSGDDATSSALVGSRSSSVGGFLQKPIVRTALPYLGIGLVILLAIVVYATMSASPPRSLYPSMADADKEQAQQLLTKNGVDVSLDPLTGALQVPASEFHEARIMLAAAGLPREATTGFSGLKDNMPLGTSQFMEQARYNASIEEELAQSIRRINTVQDARVHLALPRQSAFVRDRAEPKASVIVTPYNGRAVSEGQVLAIVHLVSSSIPYMTPANVSVVDQFGRLLTETPDSKDLSAKQLELRQRLEADYADRVVQLLGPIFGANNVRAQVNADLDFSIIERTVENFDPTSTGTKVRSEQLRESTTTEPKSEGVPGSLSNEPPPPVTATPDAAVPAESAPGTNEPVVRGQERSEAKNYEMDRSVQYVVDPAPRMRRLTVAVAINDAIAAPGAAAAPARRPLPAQEIARLTSLVQGAVGYNVNRGDVVNLISTSFEPPAPVTPLPVWQQPQYLDVAKYLLVALAIALVGFLVVRPIINRVTYIPPPPAAAQMSSDEMKAALIATGQVAPEAFIGAMGGVAGELSAVGGSAGGVDASEAETIEMREGESMEEFKSRLKARLKPKKKAGISAEMLDTANSYDDKVTVVRMMVEQDAKRVALVLKNLITRDLS